MFTADQLVAHLIGDYLLQNDFLATRKVSSSWVAAIHAVLYGLPFLLLCEPSWPALAVIVVTHFFIDRFRLIRFFLSGRERLGPRTEEGDPPAWLLIVCDNTVHVVINGAALTLL
jgi:hypothetical protein